MPHTFALAIPIEPQARLNQVRYSHSDNLPPKSCNFTLHAYAPAEPFANTQNASLSNKSDSRHTNEPGTNNCESHTNFNFPQSLSHHSKAECCKGNFW